MLGGPGHSVFGRPGQCEVGDLLPAHLRWHQVRAAFVLLHLVIVPSAL